jgi:chaperonin GroEL
MQLDRGYISPYLISNTDRMSAELEDASIFVTDWQLKSAQDLLPFLERLVQGGHRNMLIIADDVEGDMLATLVVNKARGILNSIAIKAPAYGDRRKAMLEDIAILTKSTVVARDLGGDLKDTQLSVLGKARRVMVTKDETTIVEGAGSTRDINARIEQIRAEMDNTDSAYDREKLQERAAKLAGGVAVLRVGAPTEVELKEKKHRVEDALSATQAAVDEGIVPGAGTAFVRAMEAVDQVHKALSGDEAIGARIVRDALPVPLRQIAVNAGETGDVIVQRVADADGPMGYNGADGQIADLTEVGVVDPTKVVRAALQNAGSVATMVLSTETLIADLPPKKTAAASPIPPGGDIGMM